MAFDWLGLADSLVGGYLGYEQAQQQLSPEEIIELTRSLTPDQYSPYSSTVTDWDAGTQTTQFTPEMQNVFDSLLNSAAGGNTQPYQRSAGLDELQTSKINYQRSRMGLPPISGTNTGGPGGPIAPGQPSPPQTMQPPGGGDTSTGNPPGFTPSDATGDPILPGNPGANYPYYPGSGNEGPPGRTPNDRWLQEFYANQGFGQGSGSQGQFGSNWDEITGWLADNKDSLQRFGRGAGIFNPLLGALIGQSGNIAGLFNPELRDDFIGPPSHLAGNRGPLTQSQGLNGQDFNFSDQEYDDITAEQGGMQTGFGFGRGPMTGADTFGGSGVGGTRRGGGRGGRTAWVNPNLPADYWDTYYGK